MLGKNTPPAVIAALMTAMGGIPKERKPHQSEVRSPEVARNLIAKAKAKRDRKAQAQLTRAASKI